MEIKPEIGTMVTFKSSFGSETGKVVGYATLDPDTLQIESDGDIFAKHYSEVTAVVATPPQISAANDNASGNTPEPPKTQGEQPSGSEDEWTKWESCGDFGFCRKCKGVGCTVERQKMVGNKVYTQVRCVDCGNVNELSAELTTEEMKEFFPNSGWLADALATVDVTAEAVASDDYLPPTVDEDNDTLPFSDYQPMVGDIVAYDDTKAIGGVQRYRGEVTSLITYPEIVIDGCIVRTIGVDFIEFVKRPISKDATIASLEARVKELETALSGVIAIAELAAYYMPGELAENQHRVLQDLQAAQDVMAKAVQ
jgi:hypothetical protein